MLTILILVLLVLAGVVALILGALIKTAHVLLILGALCLVGAFATGVVKVIK